MKTRAWMMRAGAAWVVIAGAAIAGAVLLGAGAAGCGSSSSSNVGGGNANDAGAEGGSPQDGGASAESGSSLPPRTVLDGGTSTSEAPGGDTTANPCGSISCPVPSGTCCAYPPPSGAGGYSYLCVGSDECPAPSAGGGGDAGADAGDLRPTALGCTGTANCANGNVCCIRPNDLDVGPQNHISECRGSCDSDDGQLCDPKAAMTGCPSASPCSSTNIASWGLPGTFGTCGGVTAPLM